MADILRKIAKRQVTKSEMTAEVAENKRILASLFI